MKFNLEILIAVKIHEVIDGIGALIIVIVAFLDLVGPPGDFFQYLRVDPDKFLVIIF